MGSQVSLPLQALPSSQLAFVKQPHVQSARHVSLAGHAAVAAGSHCSPGPTTPSPQPFHVWRAVVCASPGSRVVLSFASTNARMESLPAPPASTYVNLIVPATSVVQSRGLQLPIAPAFGPDVIFTPILLPETGVPAASRSRA